jgi:hypothetical protein
MIIISMLIIIFFLLLLKNNEHFINMEKNDKIYKGLYKCKDYEDVRKHLKE